MTAKIIYLKGIGALTEFFFFLRTRETGVNATYEEMGQPFKRIAQPFKRRKLSTYQI